MSWCGSQCRTPGHGHLMHCAVLLQLKPHFHLMELHFQHTYTFSYWNLKLFCFLTLLPVSSYSHVRTWQWLIQRADVIYSRHCLLTEVWLLDPCRPAPLPSFPGCNKSRGTSMPWRKTSRFYFWYFWPKKKKKEHTCPLDWHIHWAVDKQRHFLIICLKHFTFKIPLK